MKKIVSIVKESNVIIEECELANTPFSRFMGLMHRKSIPDLHGLILIPCNQIHTFNMHFPIDVITLDKENKVLHIIEAAPEWKCFKKVKNGHKVLELNAFKAKELGINIGDVLEIKKDI